MCIVCIPYYAAICIPGCQNGGICVKPGVCRCSRGWTGYRCANGTLNLLIFVILPLFTDVLVDQFTL